MNLNMTGKSILYNFALSFFILADSALAFAQAPRALESQSFKMGKWTEIQASVLKELNRSYVDTLPIDRIEKKAIDAMLADLDPYTIFIPEEENEDLEMLIGKTYGGIGAVIFKPDVNGNVIINEPYENSPAVRYGLQCGDEIMEIDGRTTHGIDSKEASSRMKGKPGTEVVFKVKKVRSGEIKDIKIVRERIKIPDIEYSGMVNDTTGYILQSGFTEGVGVQLRSEVERLKTLGMRRLILDLRGNGGGLLSEAVEIVGVFVPKGSLVVSARGRDSRESREYRTSKDPVDVNLPLILMVDSGSASSSEIVTGALKDMGRARIMGSRTFGKGLVQSIRPLPYGGQLKITTAKYYTPSGRCVQALDYSHRKADGAVEQIPGGGIEPDDSLSQVRYSRLTYSVVMSGVVEQYVLDFVGKHETIDAPSDYHFTDYEDFIRFAKTKDFDYRSSARTYFDKMREILKEDGIEGTMTSELDALAKSLDMEKEAFLRLKKDEIIPFIEEEIVVRYHFQRAGVQLRIRYDAQLKEAVAR